MPSAASPRGKDYKGLQLLRGGKRCAWRVRCLRVLPQRVEKAIVFAGLVEKIVGTH